MIGKTISHYKILEKLGEGGMGIVYKAEDTKLQREVVLKILRPESIGDPKAKERFIREARAASVLNHPNITTIHEIGEWRGKDFICMEYVEGKTLNKKIKDQRLKIKEITKYAIQIAEALQAAHEKGIVHRDIKSENIMITAKDQVKIMDFGLAKIKGTATKTIVGATMGTIAYMSPEQLRGETVDFRTDIWSFGVVLHEMLSGRLPFRGDHELAIAYSWCDEENDGWDIYFKPIGEKYRHRVTTDPAVERRPIWSPDGNYIAFVRYTHEKPAIYAVPFTGGAEKKLYTFRSNFHGWYFTHIKLNWSPDGALLVFSDQDSSTNNLCIYALSMQNQKIQKLTSPTENSNGDVGATFSPDGTMLAFIRIETFMVGHIYILHLNDKKITQLTSDNENIWDLLWTNNSREIIFSSLRSGMSSLWRVSVRGGKPEACAMSGINAVSLTLSPDGTKLAYEEEPAQDNIWRIDLSAINKSPAKLIYSNEIDYSPTYSPDGTKIAFGSKRSGFSEIWVCDSAGQNPFQITKLECSHCGSPSWSPDGRHIAFDARIQDHADLFMIDAQRGSLKQIISDPSEDECPYWSHDGKWIYFNSDRSGRFQIWKVPAQGGKAIQITSEGGRHAVESYDGHWLYYEHFNQMYNAYHGIGKIPVNGGNEQSVLDIDLSFGNYWALVKNGIYYNNWISHEHNALNFYSFKSGTIKRKGVINLNVLTGIDISPDVHYLIAAHWEREADIMLVENFR
jgi:serine/threonine protein kinase